MAATSIVDPGRLEIINLPCLQPISTSGIMSSLSLILSLAAYVSVSHSAISRLQHQWYTLALDSAPTCQGAGSAQRGF